MASTNETALVLRATDNMTATPALGAPGSPEFEATAMHMAREFSEVMADIARAATALHAATKRLDTAFRTEADGDCHYSRFGLDLQYRRHSCNDAGEIRKLLEREAWGQLVDALGIKNVMSVAKRKEFDAQLERGELPPICEETITAILLGLAGQASNFAQEAAKEVFDMLRPRNNWGGEYKTNNAFRVGKRVILPYRIEQAYGGGFRVTYGREQELTALDGVFHLMDGRGIMRENKGPLVAAINATDKTGRGETEYFRYKCFKNRNLHLEFKRLDLVKQLNGLAAGEYVLGEDVD